LKEKQTEMSDIDTKIRLMVNLTDLFQQMTFYQQRLDEINPRIQKGYDTIDTWMGGKRTDESWAESVKYKVQLKIDEYWWDQSRDDKFNCKKIMRHGPRKGQQCNEIIYGSNGNRCVKHTMTVEEHRIEQQQRYEQEQQMMPELEKIAMQEVNLEKAQHEQKLALEKAKVADAWNKKRRALQAELDVILSRISETREKLKILDPLACETLFDVLREKETRLVLRETRSFMTEC
jgi:hypothetical protein